MVHLSQIMELDMEMSSLEITVKKRRLSGIVNPNTVAYLPALDQSPEAMGRVGKGLNIATRKSSRTTKPLNVVFDKPEIQNKIKPKLTDLNLETDKKEIKKIYTKKSLKQMNPSLETIFEDPVNEKVMSAKKLRRVVNFSEAKKLKTKKRVMKAKKVTAKKRIKQKSISMESFLQKLADIDSENEEN